MPHDPFVCLEDAVAACKLIQQFTQDINEEQYAADLKTQSAVERQFEIIGEALNRIKHIDLTLLDHIEIGARLSGSET